MSMFVFLLSTLCPDTSRQPLRFYYIRSISVSSSKGHCQPAPVLLAVSTGTRPSSQREPIHTIRYYITSQRIV